MDPDAFRAALETLSYRYHKHHPFDKLLQSGRASREMLRLWAANRYYYQDTIPRKDAYVVANCPRSDVRGAWVQHVVTHDVDGALGEWLLLTRALGLDDAEVDSGAHLLPATKFACDAYLTFCRDAPWEEAMCASMTHLFAGDIHATRIANWPERYPWLPDEAFTYFRKRVGTLPGEIDYSLRTLCTHFGASPERLARAKEIVRFKQDVLWCMLDALWHHFFARACRVPERAPEEPHHHHVLRLLGSGAGGGVPQWNRHDDANEAARHGAAPTRTQCSAALRLCDGENVWALFNCSPDFGAQWNALVRDFPGATLRHVVLTDAQLDHVTGLLSLREHRDASAPLRLHCTDAVRATLEDDLRLLPALRAYGVPLEVVPLVPDAPVPLGPRVVPRILCAGRRPRYATRDSEVLALEVGDATRPCCYAPCVPEVSDATAVLFARCGTLWLDGTFATADEMPEVKGHLSMNALRAMGAARWPGATVRFVHVNHSNPEGAREGGDVGGDGAEVGVDV